MFVYYIVPYLSGVPPQERGIGNFLCTNFLKIKTCDWSTGEVGVGGPGWGEGVVDSHTGSRIRKREVGGCFPIF